MPKIRFTPNLKRFFPELKPIELEVETVATLIEALEQLHPGIRGYLVDDQGALREHVNIFVGQELIQDKTGLTDTLKSSDEVHILQALSGG